MNKKQIILLGILSGLILISCNSFGGKIIYYDSSYKLGKINKVIYFQPSIFPEIEEIKSPTYQTFFSAIMDQMNNYNQNIKVILINQSLDYDNINQEYIKEIGENNEAQAIIIPHIKYFKVGLGKYVFSNQILISLKLFDNKGNFLMETQFDTYKGKARLIGKAENSIRIGTKEALKQLVKDLRKKKML